MFISKPEDLRNSLNVKEIHKMPMNLHQIEEKSLVFLLWHNKDFPPKKKELLK